MELFDRNKRTVKEIYDGFDQEKLIVDPSYQRRQVWLVQDKVRLIETILMGLIIPEVFFWPASIDPETGNAITHIVDGQQRIDAIIEFIEGQYRLVPKYLLDERIREEFGNKSFAELPPEAKKAIWTYKLSVVDIDKSWTIEQIKNMFYRLNLTNYSLNEQEKRNSKVSVFGDKAEALISHDFWKRMRVFSANDARRMLDTVFCCSVYILANEGVVDQTNSGKVNQYYDDYADSFDEDNALTEKIVHAMDIIEQFHDKSTAAFLSKKAQLYTMFCIAFRIIDEGIVVSDDLFAKIKLYITAYNLFRNGAEYSFESPEIAAIYDSIKKYKLASSEGINKMQNRIIRYEQLYKVCVLGNENTIENMTSLVGVLSDDMKNRITAREEEDLEEE